MSQPRFVVLGASGAGLKAAARARRLLPAADITVIDERELISFGSCGLPYYLSGEVQRLDALRETGWGAVRDADFFRTLQGLNVLTGLRIVAIDRDAKAVTVEHASDGSERTMLMYDKLVYALGAAPRVPAGCELGPCIMAATSPEAVRDLRYDLERRAVSSCIVVGGGIAGLEFTAALTDLWGCEATLVEATDRLLPAYLDPDMSRLVESALERRGVRVRTRLAVTAAETANGLAVVSTRGEQFVADRAALATGIRRRTRLAQAAGLAVGELGGLIVDANLRTSDPDILAVGDCIELVDHTSGEICCLALGSLSARQGRVAGDVLAGRDTTFPAVVGSVAVRILDQDVAATGLSETAALAAGLDPLVAWGCFGDRTQFHPERRLIYLKLVYEAETDRLLGLQAIGPGEVVKRVDVFAALLRQDADLADLLDTEFCYSPPFNAPSDPLQDLAAAVLNARETGLRQVSPFGQLDGRLVVDVRGRAEFAAGAPPSLPGAVNLPLEELRGRMGELPAGRPLLLVCAKGPRSFEAARILQHHGFHDLVYLAGGVEMRAGDRRSLTN
ncbi:MAG TPA: FAD-dependent oxidoreductase [Candidatus Krumholzibacteria bacterium]|nr:FAD-dependent oxidoreductase [Candidatus Krumholzibacteria bacterium]HPD73347.1 FAD-dependent oxidoreductase [Candidatus Krumholzibacteria bacterium]HRY42132.1 FAD-dependent oxidoreductase [Candidatus Krumholzibacteria bacterium]